MPITLLDSSFLSNTITSNLFKPQRKTVQVHVLKLGSISCNHDQNGHDVSPRKSQPHFSQVALVAMAAGLLTLGSVDPAEAAKTGGRVGGKAFRSAAPQPQRSSGPRINNSRTNIYINPRVAPPLGGGYGYGFGGWGWSPFSFFAPGPSVAVGVGGGLDLIVLFILLGTVSAVFRRFFGSRQDNDDDDEEMY